MMRTLRGRLAVLSALMFAALFAVVGQVSYSVLAHWLDADATTRLTELTDGLRGYLHFEAAGPEIAFDRDDLETSAFIHDATQIYQLYDAKSGRVLVRSDGARSFGLAFAPDLIHAFVDAPRAVDVYTRRGRVRLSNSVIDRRSDGTYLLQVGVAMAGTDESLGRYRRRLLWFLPVALVVAAVTAWGLGSIALSPLVRVADAARTIDVSRLATRLPVRGTGDELDQLVGGFNETLGRLERAVGEMRQFSAALAHELRTPLAIMRGELELGLRQRGGQQQLLANQLEEIDRLKRLIDQILTLARAESGQISLNVVSVDLGDLAASLVEQLQPVAEAHNIELCCEPCERVIVRGDAGWLERLLINLLDNALKFTGAGGRVTLGVCRTDGAARITVRDTGVGMSADDARRVFDRFFRADPARSSATEGAGLGLSLAQWIVQSHHGSITVESHSGTGSTFTITLPSSS